MSISADEESYHRFILSYLSSKPDAIVFRKLLQNNVLKIISKEFLLKTIELNPVLMEEVMQILTEIDEKIDYFTMTREEVVDLDSESSASGDTTNTLTAAV